MESIVESSIELDGYKLKASDKDFGGDTIVIMSGDSSVARRKLVQEDESGRLVFDADLPDYLLAGDEVWVCELNAASELVLSTDHVSLRPSHLLLECPSVTDLEKRSSGVEKELQRVMFTLQVHVTVSSFIENMDNNRISSEQNKHKDHPEQQKAAKLSQRGSLSAAYRLLCNMAHAFPPVQEALVELVPHFLEHAAVNGAWLAVHDSSPTHLVTAVYHDNKHLGMQVSEELVRQFVNLMRDAPLPRYVQFLRKLALPAGHPNVRNQILIMTSLVETENVLHLFNSRSEIEERAELIQIAQRDQQPLEGPVMPTTDEGLELRYHVELIGLLGDGVQGKVNATCGLYPGPPPSLCLPALAADLDSREGMHLCVFQARTLPVVPAF